MVLNVTRSSAFELGVAYVTQPTVNPSDVSGNPRQLGRSLFLPRDPRGSTRERGERTRGKRCADLSRTAGEKETRASSVARPANDDNNGDDNDDEDVGGNGGNGRKTLFNVGPDQFHS